MEVSMCRHRNGVKWFYATVKCPRCMNVFRAILRFVAWKEKRDATCGFCGNPVDIEKNWVKDKGRKIKQFFKVIEIDSLDSLYVSMRKNRLFFSNT